MVGPQAAEKGIHIERNLPEEKLFAWIDDDKISQVLLNLYLNAFDAMEPGGLLTVSLSQPTDTMREITVSDTGRGIHRQDLPHVYDPYFTTKSSGTGLGLAIVHRIVEAHNGHVHIRSEEEEGTSVTILLPAEEAFQTSKRKGKDS
jgi:two-component system sensor histidine kinase HydH